MILKDIINGCGNLLKDSSDVDKHIEKYQNRELNYHDESMLTLVLANAFAEDKTNGYKNVSRLLNYAISLRQPKTKGLVLSTEHSVYIEYQTQALKHYNRFVRENWYNESFPRHFYKDRAETIDYRLTNGKNNNIEGNTNFDMVITSSGRDRVYFESKYLSDIDYKTTYVPCRDQITRCLDAALYEVTQGLENLDGLHNLWFS